MDSIPDIESSSESSQFKLTRGQEIKKFFVFLFFSLSAGLIQIGVFNLLILITGTENYIITYVPALAASVLWNFTINRKFNFKSVSNIRVAMLKILAYYLVFTPLSTIWGSALNRLNIGVDPALRENIINIGTMVVNFLTEFCVYRFWVYPHSINSSAAGAHEQSRIAKKKQSGHD